MYTRIINMPCGKKSFFLFGPRGTGKTTWLKTKFPNALYLDLLEAELFNDLLAHPGRLEEFIPPDFSDWIVIDEVQRVPLLLNEVHRLIEKKKYSFILTGSNARKLRRKEVNLLAGRALTYHMYPLTAVELDADFSLARALEYGHLPATFNEPDVKKYLESYVMTFLQQEVQQEGLTRNLSSFSRFLETASFSQGQVLNISEVAREAMVDRKIVENYFSILDDLLLAYRLPVFAKRAKRRLVRSDKFYFFDVGVYRILRPGGPLDLPEEIEGAALETLVFQEIKAVNEYLDMGYKLFYWRTPNHLEVDFILYGNKKIIALEVKRSNRIGEKDLRGLKAFLTDYPQSRAVMLYGGTRKLWRDGIELVPLDFFFRNLVSFLK